MTITKVNPYHLKRGESVRTEDPMIRFENRRRYRGAIYTDELRERYGHDFTVFWKTTEPKVPAVVRLHYRQAETQQTIHVEETTVSSPGRSNVTKFEVKGAEYLDQGVVTQWKVTIVQGGSEVAEYRSFLWK